MALNGLFCVDVPLRNNSLARLKHRYLTLDSRQLRFLHIHCNVGNNVHWTVMHICHRPRMRILRIKKNS